VPYCQKYTPTDCIFGDFLTSGLFTPNRHGMLKRRCMAVGKSTVWLVLYGILEIEVHMEKCIEIYKK